MDRTGFDGQARASRRGARPARGGRADLRGRASRPKSRSSSSFTGTGEPGSQRSRRDPRDDRPLDEKTADCRRSSPALTGRQEGVAAKTSALQDEPGLAEEEKSRTADAHRRARPPGGRARSPARDPASRPSPKARAEVEEVRKSLTEAEAGLRPSRGPPTNRTKDEPDGLGDPQGRDRPRPGQPRGDLLAGAQEDPPGSEGRNPAAETPRTAISKPSSKRTEGQAPEVRGGQPHGRGGIPGAEGALRLPRPAAEGPDATPSSQTKEAIVMIDEESRTQFLAALAEVNKNFQELFIAPLQGRHGRGQAHRRRPTRSRAASTSSPSRRAKRSRTWASSRAARRS